MAKNTLGELKNHLYTQLERLNDKNLTQEELKVEIDRAKSIAVISQQIIHVGSLSLQSSKFKAQYAKECIVYENKHIEN